MEIRIAELDGPSIARSLEQLSRMLADSVSAGAAISFMAPMSIEHAAQFWERDVMPEVTAGRRLLLGAERAGELVGTVQLLISMPPNQPHRCEVAKMIVHPRARRLGIGRLLMTRILDRARVLGKTLITLDTRTGDIAQGLYASVGFEVAGVIPDFAWDPDGKARHSTTYMFQRLVGT